MTWDDNGVFPLLIGWLGMTTAIPRSIPGVSTASINEE